MITLATLPQATQQEVADQIVRHALTQNKSAIKGDTCVYRTADGLACFGGCLMSDEEYNPEFECRGWVNLAMSGKVPHVHKELIVQFQDIHDYYDPEHWPEYLKNLCERYNLKYNPPENTNVD